MFSFFCGLDIRNIVQCIPNRAALVVAYLVIAGVPHSGASEANPGELTLVSAVQLALSKNPELQVYRFRDLGLQGQSKSASLLPGLVLGAELENFGGSGDFNGTDSADLTLALSSVIELGDKRGARLAVVGAHRQVMEVDRQAQALALMGDVTRRYVNVVATQARFDLAADAEKLSLETTRSVKRRVDVGATPEAELLRARAQNAQARLVVGEEQTRLESARVSLALLWGESNPGFTRVSGNLLAVGKVGSFEELFARAIQNPVISSFDNQERLLNAELRLAKTQASADIGWSLGARRFEETDDSALVASINIPLFASGRSSGARQSARAARDEVVYRREAAMLNLRAHLFELYQQRKQAIESLKSLQVNIIPPLSQALLETQKAYENGRYGYQEWVAARQELITAQYAVVDAATTALRSAADIEQLTAEPLLTTLDVDLDVTEQELK